MFSTFSLFSQLENSGPEMHGLYSFTIISEAREIHLAAGSEEEKYKWMEVKIKKINHGAIKRDLNLVSTINSNRFDFGLLHSVVDYKILASPSRPIRYKSSANRDFVTIVFSCLARR